MGDDEKFLKLKEADLPKDLAQAAQLLKASRKNWLAIANCKDQREKALKDSNKQVGEIKALVNYSLLSDLRD